MAYFLKYFKHAGLKKRAWHDIFQIMLKVLAIEEKEPKKNWENKETD